MPATRRRLIHAARHQNRANEKQGTSAGEKSEPNDDRDHFYICGECWQRVDMRDLGQVLHHEMEGHKPLPEED